MSHENHEIQKKRKKERKNHMVELKHTAEGKKKHKRETSL